MMPFIRGKHHKKLSKVKVRFLRGGKYSTRYSAFPLHRKSNPQEKPNDTIFEDEIPFNNFQSNIDGDHNVDFSEIFSEPSAKTRKKKTYQELKEKELSAWNEEDHVTEYLKRYEFLTALPCSVCSNTDLLQHIWCKSCGEFTVFCDECALERHQTSPFHSLFCLDKKTFCFEKFDFRRKIVDPHVDACNTAYTRNITVITNNVDAVVCEVSFCLCGTEFATLLRHNLWPASPQKPGTAISIDLLLILVALQFEGKISFLSFCDAMAWKDGYCKNHVKQSLYRFMQTDSIDQFRKFRKNLCTLKDLVPGYNHLSKCSACPKENGDAFYCIDANFGLVLKNSASKSSALPKSEELFLSDTTVKDFMKNYQDEGEKDKECSNFQAGDMLRSKRKSKKLSVTGILGASCRHEFPKVFLNLFHGERMGYVVLVLEKLLTESATKKLDVHILYDVACILKRHLLNKGNLSRYNFQFAVPAFHAYGHSSSCQILNSVRRLNSFGLMDGELMERLWSYLRSFSKMTKEMTPAHRVDFLTDALFHFGSIKMLRIGKSLTKLHAKAVDIRDTCESELLKISSSFTENGGQITPAVAERWKSSQESEAQRKPEKSSSDRYEWQMKYYRNLDQLTQEKSLILTSSSLSESAAHETKASKLEKKIRKLENKHKIQERWSKKHPMYIFFRKKDLETKKQSIVDTLQNRCVERLFLLVLKKRYADGSAIGNRVSKQIGKACSELKNLVGSFNSVCRELGISESITYQDVIKEEFVLASSANLSQCSDYVPVRTKHMVVNYFSRMNRAIEEISLVETEMEQVLSYWVGQYEVLQSSFDKLPFGGKILVQRHLVFVQCMIVELKQVFDPFVDTSLAENIKSNFASREQYDSDISLETSTSCSDYSTDTETSGDEL